MKRTFQLLVIAALLILPCAVFGQGTTNYPALLDDSTSLPEPVDSKAAILTTYLSSTATTAEVVSTEGFPAKGVLMIDREQIAYTGLTSTSFTGLTRGFGGTLARPHSINMTVRSTIVAAHVNGNRLAILELEKKLGTGASNYSAADAGDVLTKLGDGSTGWVPGAAGSEDGLTDAELRASPVPVFGPLTDAQLRATAVPTSVSSLPLPSGAATSAKQDTGNTSLSSIDGKLPTALVSGRLDVNIGNTPNVSVTNTPTVAISQSTTANDVDATIVGTPNVSVTNIPHVIVDTAPTTAVTGTFWPGTQPVSGTFWQATQPISAAALPLPPLAATSTKQSDGSQKTQLVDGSGNVIGSTSNALDINIKSGNLTSITANAGTNLNTSALALDATQTNRTQKTQITDGTRDGTLKAASTLPLATDTAVVVTQRDALPAGSNVIGHVIADSGSTTAVTGTVTVSGTVTANAGSGTLAVSGPLTDAQLRASAVPVSGTVTANAGSGTFTVSGTVTTTPPSNASTNVAQLAGTATSVNSGVKDAGTLRVVLATDQPALTNKLLVTPDSVALPANQSVNVNQLAGTTTDTNSGTKSAGTLRVVLATDQPQLTNKLLVTPDANSAINVAQVGGTNTVTVAAGVQKVGIVGNANAAFDAANNAAAPANILATGLESIAQGTQPTAATSLNMRRQIATTEGVAFVQEGNSNRFSCFVQAVTVITQCQAAPGAGLRAYVTSAHFSNQAATVQTLDLVFGTGANCVTSPVAITHKVQMGTNATTTSPQSVDMNFTTPLVPTAANAICVRPSAATAFGATITGFIAP